MENNEELGPLQPAIEAEEAMLGSMLIDPEAIHEVRAIVEPDMVYREANQLILKAMYELDGRQEPTDLITLTNELRRMESLEIVGGEAYIIGLINTVPTSVNVVAYAMIVRDSAWRRRGLVALSQIAQLLHDEELETDDVMDQAESILFSVRDQEHGHGKGYQTSKEVVVEFMDQVESAAASEDGMIGAPWPFKDLNHITGGMVDDLTIVGARPGMGKTSFLLSIAENTALRQGRNVGIFSIEMNPKALMNRLISRHSQIDSRRIRRGQLMEQEWSTFYEAAGKMSEAGLFIDHTAVRASQMRARARRWHARYNLDVILIDYLQLMHAEIAEVKAPRVQQLATMTRTLKTLGAELDVPIIVASQLNRGVETRQEKRPGLADLRDSGTIEQDADVVLFIYRDEYYEGDSSERPNIAEINLAKNREGVTATVDLFWQATMATFRDLARQEISLDQEWPSKNGHSKPATGPLFPQPTQAAMSASNGD